MIIPFFITASILFLASIIVICFYNILVKIKNLSYLVVSLKDDLKERFERYDELKSSVAKKENEARLNSLRAAFGGKVKEDE